MRFASCGKERRPPQIPSATNRTTYLISDYKMADETGQTNSIVLAQNSSVIGSDHPLLNSTFEYSRSNKGFITNYQGLSESTIASMPLEALYKRIDRQMNKTKSNFDLRLSQAIKQNEPSNLMMSIND